MLLSQRLSAERNTSDSDSVGVSTGENCRENGVTHTHGLKSIQAAFCWLKILLPEFINLHVSHGLHQWMEFAQFLLHDLVLILLYSIFVVEMGEFFNACGT